MKGIRKFKVGIASGVLTVAILGLGVVGTHSLPTQLQLSAKQTLALAPFTLSPPSGSFDSSTKITSHSGIGAQATTPVTPSPAIAETVVGKAPSWIQSSPILAGYVVGGGPFSYITSTFTIPVLTNIPAVNTDISIWDGFQNSTGSQIFQAGVAAGSYDLVQGNYQWYAWFYNTSTDNLVMPVSVTVSAEDVVTVTLVQISEENWEIQFTNDTTGQTQSIPQIWPETSNTAEWDVESPPTSPQNSSLIPYSGVVNFWGLGLIGKQSGFGEWSMYQPDGQTATPQNLDWDGVSIVDS